VKCGGKPEGFRGTPLLGRRRRSFRKRVAGRKRRQPYSPPAAALQDAKRRAEGVANPPTEVKCGGKPEGFQGTPLFGKAPPFILETSRGSKAVALPGRMKKFVSRRDAEQV